MRNRAHALVGPRPQCARMPSISHSFNAKNYTEMVEAESRITQDHWRRAERRHKCVRSGRGLMMVLAWMLGSGVRGARVVRVACCEELWLRRASCLARGLGPAFQAGRLARAYVYAVVSPSGTRGRGKGRKGPAEKRFDFRSPSFLTNLVPYTHRPSPKSCRFTAFSR